jgi:hypothetical protein
MSVFTKIKNAERPLRTGNGRYLKRKGLGKKLCLDYLKDLSNKFRRKKARMQRKIQAFRPKMRKKTQITLDHNIRSNFMLKTPQIVYISKKKKITTFIL